MSSVAASIFSSLAARSDELKTAGVKVWEEKRDIHKAQSFYGASIVLQVAAWETYIEKLVFCVYDELNRSLNWNGKQVLQLMRSRSENEIKRFHTPNSQNVRETLIAATGYDPWPDWVWGRASISSMKMRQYLDEVIRVRHSVAHGTPLPKYNWLTNKRGQERLTAKHVTWFGAFFQNIVSKTDRGMGNYLKSSFSIQKVW